MTAPTPACDVPGPCSGSRCVALVPAGGTGSRFGGARPKQYLAVAGVPIIVHAVRALLRAPWIQGVHVVVAPGDREWAAIAAAYRPEWGERVFVHPTGGPTRRDTVLAGLDALAAGGFADADTWVLVHDAARPALPSSRLQALGAALADEPVGALLALPLADTLKRAEVGGDGDRAGSTVPRTGLWLAQTPQAFRLGLLQRALRASADVTDESSAVERLGLRPRLLTGSWRNLKLTHPQDLDLVEFALAHPETR